MTAAQDPSAQVDTPPTQVRLVGTRDFMATWLLSLILGTLGVDRFYLGKIGTGILKLLTLGGFGIWYLIDLIIILAGGASDKTGYALANEPKDRGKYWLITAGVIVFLLIASGINNAVNGNLTNSVNKPDADSKVASAIARAQSSPKPIQDVTTEEGLRAAIVKALGTSTNRDVPKNVGVDFMGRDLYVQFALDDNLSRDLIIVGAWKSTEAIIKLAQQSGLVDNLTVNGTYAFQDKYGNPVGERAVFTANFLDNSIPKINTEAFVSSMYEDVASSVIIDPSFQ